MPQLPGVPALQYRDATEAIAFLTRAFGFAEKAVYRAPDGSVIHAELTLGNGMVLIDAMRPTSFSRLLAAPEAAGGGTKRRYCAVADAHIRFAKASGAGAEIVRAPVTRDYGGR